MRNRSRAAVLLVLVIAGGALFFGTAMAATAPSIASNSDISDGATISVTNASGDTVSHLNVTTTASENANVSVEITLDDRDMTVYEADDDSDDYTLVEENNTDSEDVHSFAISHDEFADVPVAANGSVELNYTVVATASDDTTANTTGSFTLDNGWQRSVIVLDQTALDGDVSGLSVSDENESSLWDNIPTVDTSSTVYDAESEDRAINGSNTTVHVYYQDSDVADNFDSASDAGVLSGTLRGYVANLEAPGISTLGDSLAPDVSAESGDRTFGMTAAAGGEAVPVFIDSADSDLVDDNTTYAVYDTSNAELVYHLGEGDYDGEETVDIRTASNEPEQVFGMDSFSDAMTSDLSTRQFIEAFGVQAWGANLLGGISLFIAGFAGIGLRRRRAAMEG